MSPKKYCYSEIKKSNSSLYYAMLFLSKKLRDPLIVVYALGKRIIKIISEQNNSIGSYTQISWWRNQIVDIQNSKNKHPILKALITIIEEYPELKIIIIDFIDKNEILIEQHKFISFEKLNENYWSVDKLLYETFSIIDETKSLIKRPEADIISAITMTKTIRNIGKDITNRKVILPLNKINQYSKKAEYDINALIEIQIRKTNELYKKTICNYAKYKTTASKFYISVAAAYYELLQELYKRRNLILDQYITLSPYKKICTLWLARITNGSTMIKKINKQQSYIIK